MSLEGSPRLAWEWGPYTDRCPKNEREIETMNEREEKTMCRGRKLALLAGVALVLGLAPMLPASAAEVLRIPFNGVRTNACTGESVLLTGETVIVTNEDSPGCFTKTISVHLTGVSLSGVQYVANGKIITTFCDPDPDSCGSTQTFTMRLVFLTPSGALTNTVSLTTITQTEIPTAEGGCEVVTQENIQLLCVG
jgi:hypothetical protein